jgi:hypothetical protein
MYEKTCIVNQGMWITTPHVALPVRHLSPLSYAWAFSIVYIIDDLFLVFA